MTSLSRGDVLETTRMDGGKAHDEFYQALLLSLSGSASTSLIAMIFAWNGTSWSQNLTATNAAPLTAFIASLSRPEGLFAGLT